MKRDALTTGGIQGNTGRETLKNNGSIAKYGIIAPNLELFKINKKKLFFCGEIFLIQCYNFYRKYEFYY